jgi:hypothetical protein
MLANWSNISPDSQKPIKNEGFAQSSRGLEAEDERLTAGGRISTAESLKSIVKQFVW